MLAILTPTLPDRRDLLSRLGRRLRPQLSGCPDDVVWRTLCDDGAAPVGLKRQRLLAAETAAYVAFVDDDDELAADYVARILAGIRDGADVVGFRLAHYTDGRLTGRAVHTLAVSAWSTEQQDDGLYLYQRTPNHLNPIQRELALSIGYRPMEIGEDADYSRRLYAAHGATMREHFIDAVMYHYLWRSRVPAPPIGDYDARGHLTRAGAERAIRAGGTAVYCGRVCARVEQLDK